MHLKQTVSIENRRFLALQRNSRNSVRAFRAAEGQMHQKRRVSIEKRRFLGLQHNSRNVVQI